MSFVAAASAPSAVASVQITGTAGGLSHRVAVTVTVNAAHASGADMVTYYCDVARTGLNPNETILTTSNVTSSRFGLVRLFNLDGKVDAQPLYLWQFFVAGQPQNVMFAATEHDSVYAFNADTGAPLWKTSILGASETTSDSHLCSQIAPEIGITSTPVIDRSAGRS